MSSNRPGRLRRLNPRRFVVQPARPSWSLRGRLLVGILGLLAVVCLGIGAVSTVAVQHVLVDQLDRSLFAAAARAEGRIHPYGYAELAEPDDGQSGEDDPTEDPNATPPDGARFPPGQSIGTINCVVPSAGSPRAAVLAGNGDAQALNPTQFAVLSAVPVDGRPRSVTVDGLGDYRVVARTVAGSTVVTGLPLAPVQETVWRLVLIELLVGGAALVLAAGVGMLVVGGALSPLRRVAATARRVSELPLSRGDVDLTVRVPTEHTDPRTEVGQVGAALNRMLHHVADALAVRHGSETRVRQFVADASHELRTPLAAIRGYAELTRRAPDQVPADLAHALSRIEAEARRMTMLLDDLLLLARLDSGRPLEREPVPLSRLVVDAVGDARAAGPGHTWRLVLPEEPVTVTGDRARLQQVLGNLLANARVHTPPGTTVTTSLAVADGQAMLTVADDGPGIAEHLRGEIFERFVRGDGSRSRTAGSTGLGLSIVAAVVEAHSGHVDVDSRGGTVFRVVLPGGVLGG